MRPVVKEIEQSDQNTKVIIDYNDTDFRTFWKGKVEEILHIQESKIIQNTPFTQSGWFLDLGCGHGRLTPSYYTPERKIICVDYAINHLEMAMESQPYKNIYYIAADACRLPFRENAFSNGISIRLFHHIQNDQQFLKEIKRVFAQNAVLLLSYMNCRNLLRIIRFGKQCFRKEHIQIADVLFASHPQYMKQSLKQNNWRIQQNSGAGLLYQIASLTSRIEKTVAGNKITYKSFQYTDNFLSYILGKCNLALMQYLQLVNNKTINSHLEEKSLHEVLQCPQCGTKELNIQSNQISCTTCQTVYPIQGGIIDFRI